MTAPSLHVQQEAGYRPIRAMSAEERRAYNRIVKQRSRAKAALKARSGRLPGTKEAAMSLIAVAASRLALGDTGTLAKSLAAEVAMLIGASCDAVFEDDLDFLLRRIAAPRRQSVPFA